MSHWILFDMYEKQRLIMHWLKRNIAPTVWSVLMYNTFWMLSSTRPPRTYTLSASTVSKAEKNKGKKSYQRESNSQKHSICEYECCILQGCVSISLISMI